MEVELAAPVVEEALAQEETAAAVLALVSGVARMWTSLQLFGPQSRPRLRPLCRVSQPSPRQQWRNAQRQMAVGEASLLS